MGKQVITRVYQVIKRDGRIVSFDISKIAIVNSTYHRHPSQRLLSAVGKLPLG